MFKDGVLSPSLLQIKYGVYLGFRKHPKHTNGTIPTIGWLRHGVKTDSLDKNKHI